jgi:uncharacterized protein (DUF1330 family)
MTAYVLVDIDIKDPPLYADYESLVSETVAAYGGRYLACGGRTETFEGDWQPKRLIILEFESLERARQWLDSPEYVPVKRLRHKAAQSNMVAIEGA